MRKLFKIILLFVFSALVIILIAGLWFGIKGYYMYKNAVNETPINEKVESIRNSNNFIKYEELPQIYIDAVVSAEDKRFWNHCGIDILAICRAAWNDLKSFSFVEGGSTITQQFMKNEYFTQDKNFERKFAEIFAALNIEKILNKKEIFELYVNTIYFGNGYYGIYEASQGYYGKEPSELNDYEAIMLAGIPNAPSFYSSETGAKYAITRMKNVLATMVENNFISSEDSKRIYLSGN